MGWLRVHTSEQGLAAASRAPPPGAGAASRMPPRRAAAALAFAGSLHAEGPRRNPGGPTYERVLRYPDGHVRRIRYPAPPADAVSDDAAVGRWETLNEWKSLTTWQDDEAPAAGERRASGQGVSSSGAALAPPPPAVDEVPLSPLQLLRRMTSGAYQREQAQRLEEVAGSYEVLEGCPWIAPKPLFLLAAAPHSTDADEPAAGLTYTLRTRVAEAGVDDELGRVLGRRRADGAPLIRCSRLADGVVAFEDEGDAERYSERLEAAGRPAVALVRCDSHELFRGTQETRGVVVLLRRGGPAVEPHELSAALRGHRSIEDGIED